MKWKWLRILYTFIKSANLHWAWKDFLYFFIVFFDSFMINFRILVSVNTAAPAKQTEPSLSVATKTPIPHQPRNLQLWVKLLLPTQSNLPAWLWQYFLAVSWWHSTFSRTCKKSFHCTIPAICLSLGSKSVASWCRFGLCSAKKLHNFSCMCHRIGRGMPILAKPHSCPKKTRETETDTGCLRIKNKLKFLSWYFDISADFLLVCVLL